MSVPAAGMAGLHMHRLCPTGIHLVRTGGLEPHQPALNPNAGLERVDSLLARRGTKDRRG